MKLTYRTDEDVQELKALIIKLLPINTPVSGLSARKLFNSEYSIDIDHHVIAYVLDTLHNSGKATHYNHNSGDTQYIVKG